MAEELIAIQCDPLTAIIPAVRPEPFLLRHPSRIRAWSRNIQEAPLSVEIVAVIMGG
jgi:hypothetical protein